MAAEASAELREGVPPLAGTQRREIAVDPGDRRGVPLGRRGRLRRGGPGRRPRAAARRNQRTPPCSARRCFCFPRGVQIRLSDIPPGGVWIRLLGSRHGKSVYRVTVQTRSPGQPRPGDQRQPRADREKEVREEIDWLILSGDPERPRCRWSRISAATGRSRTCGPRSSSRARRWTAPCAACPSGPTSRSGSSSSGRSWPGPRSAPTSDFWNRTGGLLEIADPEHVRRRRAHRTTTTPACGSSRVSARRPYRGLPHMLLVLHGRVHPAGAATVSGAGRTGRLGRRLLFGARRWSARMRACSSSSELWSSTPDLADDPMLRRAEGLRRSGAGAGFPAPPPVLRRQALPPLGAAERRRHAGGPGAHAAGALGHLRTAATDAGLPRGAAASLPRDRLPRRPRRPWSQGLETLDRRGPRRRIACPTS